MVYVKFLKKIEDFEDLNENDLAIIQSCGKIKKFKHGEKIFSEGENADHIWIVYEGEIGLRFGLPEHLNLSNDSYALLTGSGSKPGYIKKKKTTSKDNTIATLTEGKTFGWGSFVPPYTYSLSAYCDSISCHVMQLQKEQLLKTFGENPRIGYIFMTNIARVIGARFHKLQEEVVNRKGWEIMFRW